MHCKAGRSASRRLAAAFILPLMGLMAGRQAAAAAHTPTAEPPTQRAVLAEAASASVAPTHVDPGAKGPPPEIAGSAAASAQAKKVLNRLVNAIRYEHDDKAIAQLDIGLLSQRLLGETWSHLSGPEQSELVAGLELIIRRVSFARGREVFKYLNAVRFEPPVQEGELIRVRSTVVIFRDLKKSEIVIDWLMAGTPEGPKVVDTVMLQESTADAIRDEQIKPLLAEGGVPALMAALRKKVAEVRG